MWPMKKTTVLIPQSSAKLDEEKSHLVDVAKLKTWRDIGDSFNYLGRTMVATSHEKIIVMPSSLYKIPCLTAEYADEHGIIHKIELSMAVCKKLMASQPAALPATPGQPPAAAHEAPG